MVLHNRISIRWFAAKKKYLLYTLSSLILLTGFFLLIYITMKGSYDSFNRDDVYSMVLPVFIITSCVMIPFAFTYYYAGIAQKHKNGWQYLLEQKVISLEAVFHILVVAVLLIAVAANMSTASGLLTLFEAIIGLMVFYTTAYILIINNLQKKKYVWFIIYSLLTILVFAAIVSLMSGIFTYAGLHSRGITTSFLKTLEFPSFDLLIFALPGIIYAYARKLFKDREELGFSLFHQKEAEFNQLKAQVNPHFLFNSLNTVYAFALKEGNEKTAESIAKLANMMRYLIDDMEQDEIPIKKEVGYIEDYIKLQLIRSSVEHNIQLNIDLNEDQESQMIAPMLMIPFVENAFKHGINPNATSELKLKVSFVDGKFQFVLENSIDKNFEAFYKEKGFGIGIENIRKRLEHIYPDKHTLSIADTEDRFIVIMEIQL
jgi:sensor histidine kinase YesM